MTMKTALAGAIALVGFACVLPGQSAAATLNSCATGAVSNTSACQYLTPPDTSYVASVSNINAAGFFGFTDWESNNQTQIDPANNQSGTWTIANVDFATYDYAIFFKDGANTNLIGFLFDETASTGTWTTPFTNPPFAGLNENQQKDVSHYTIVRHPGGTTEVPEPTTLAVLGAGLIGLGCVRRRKES